MTNTLTDVSNMSLTDTYDVCTSCMLKVNSVGEGRVNTVGTWLDQFCLRDQGEKNTSNFVKVCQSWLGFNAFGLLRG